MTTHPESPEALDSLATLAREQLTGDLPLPARVRIEESLKKTWPPRKARVDSWGWRIIAVAATFLIAIGLVFVRLRPTSPSALTFVVEGDATTQLRFSDGTRVQMAHDSSVRVVETTSHGARITLLFGQMHCEVVANPGAQWAVSAGPFVVAVHGTVFDLAWNASSQSVQVALKEGSVSVSGPFGQEVPLKSGQELVAHASEHSFSIEPIEPGVAHFLVPEGSNPMPEDSATPAIADAMPSASHAPLLPIASAQRSWHALAADGDFDAILRSAEKTGVSVACSTRGLADLAALGDAARYRHRPEIARQAYVSLRSRFVGSSQAKQAAFMLGRLAEPEAPIDALGWYATYLQEDPGGVYAEEALGRTMTVTLQIRGKTEARPVADRYLASYPEGSFARAAKSIAGTTP